MVNGEPSTIRSYAINNENKQLNIYMVRLMPRVNRVFFLGLIITRTPGVRTAVVTDHQQVVLLLLPRSR